MLMALTLAILNSAGIAPTPEDLQNYKLQFRERGHHIHMDFGTTRTPQEGGKAFTWGLGYEYYVDRFYNGVSFEILGQKLGKPFQGPQDWWIGGGIGWWPIRGLKIFTQVGALFDFKGRATQGRLGVGYRFLFFMMGVMPYIYVQTTDTGRFSWSLGVRIQY